MRVKRFKTPVVLVVALLLFVVVAPLPVWASEVDAANAISSAKNTILNCFNAAKQAEAAGANITALVDILNDANLLLSQAELTYATNDFDAATQFATQSQNKLSTFIVQAESLKQTASQQQSQDFLINVAGSIIGAVAVVVAGFTVWVFLKRRYGTVM